MASGPVAGLTDGRVQPEVADELPCRWKAPDVADDGDQRGRSHGIDAGDGQQPPDIRVSDGLSGDDRVDLGQLGAEEVELPQARVDSQAFIDRQLLGGDPLASLLAERVAGWVAAFEVAVQGGRDLVLDLRAALDRPAPARHQPTQHANPVIADPHRWNQIRGQQIGQHLGVDLVGLDPGVTDRPHLLGMRKHDFAHVRLDDPGDRQRVAGRLQHHPVITSQTAREQLQLLRRGRDPSR